MAKELIIVESPTKIKTLKKFLGGSYDFESSLGHIRDLPEKEFGVDVEHDFEPVYVTMPKKEEVIRNLKRKAKDASVVYLAPDPDREGEAIAWHILQILPKHVEAKRISFHSITKKAVEEALENPREVNLALVDAQQARRVLDRLVGYSISPILNRKIQRGKGESVSGGRVQSVALRLVVDREREIEAFKAQEYWTIEAVLKTDKDSVPFTATLFSVQGVKIEKEAIEGKEVYLVNNEEKANSLVKRLDKASYKVTRVERKEKKRHPVPPFITSTLQQEASRHFGFSSARTMDIAQSLYEGVDLGSEGMEGLITYMRTDSFRVVPEAIGAARKLIEKQFGKDYLPEGAKTYSSKKSAQDAHEAIRPTDVFKTPEALQKHLTHDQFRLYQLVWRRFVASQMVAALYDTLSADIEAKDMLFRATGSTLKFSGFLAVYEERVDEESEKEENRPIPSLEEGQSLSLIDLKKEQSFTRPPPRYSEASLVKELEKSGIGRPSTYATIMNKIQSRAYTVKEQGRLRPTELGCVVRDLLVSSFGEIMAIDFTAQMEDELEDVAENKREWKEIIRSFWHRFEPNLEIAKNEAFVPKVQTELKCPKCQEGHLQKVWSKSKYFYGCNRYPDCDFTAPLEEIHFKKEDYAPDFNWEQACPICEGSMKLRHGRFGPFLGCIKYPECKGIVNIPKKGDTALIQQDLPPCPAIGCTGKLVGKKSRFGKVFYSCSTFPDCDVIVNDLDQIQEKYAHYEKKAYEKKKRGKSKSVQVGTKKPKGKAKSVKAKPSIGISEELELFLNKKELSRQEALKAIWGYIKEKNLQDLSNKRIINPDAKLGALVGTKDPFDMMQLPKLLSPHLKKQVKE